MASPRLTSSPLTVLYCACMSMVPSYEEWVTRFDRTSGDRWRHRERRPASIEGPKFDAPAPRDIRSFSAVIDGGKVHYHLSGSRDTPAFTDRGKTIDIHDSRRRASVLAALQLSAQKSGTISVRGNEQFRRTYVELAAEHGFKIENPELQQAIAAQREQLRLAKEAASPEHSRPDSMTPSAIYGRHLDAIIREQPARRADPSRLDAEVAVRMAVTGHSREGIAAAIEEGARVDRPDEKRDWNLYAQRAVGFAFSPPGREMRVELERQEQRLVRIEGREGEIELLRKLGGPMRYG